MERLTCRPNFYVIHFFHLIMIVIFKGYILYINISLSCLRKLCYTEISVPYIKMYQRDALSNNPSCKGDASWPITILIYFAVLCSAFIMQSGIASLSSN